MQFVLRKLFYCLIQVYLLIIMCKSKMSNVRFRYLQVVSLHKFSQHDQILKLPTHVITIKTSLSAFNLCWWIKGSWVKYENWCETELTDAQWKHTRAQHEIVDYTDLQGALITLRSCWQCPVMRTSGQHRLNDMSGSVYTRHTQEGNKEINLI